MNAQQRKQYSVKQDDDDRRNFDKKWDRLNHKLKASDPHYSEPECKHQEV
jgi:hypothetical protein